MALAVEIQFPALTQTQSSLARSINGEVFMKKDQGFISILLLATMVSLSCAQTSEKNAANLPAAAGPELRWKYESGG
jgi:hypothetical protein